MTVFNVRTFIIEVLFGQRETPPTYFDDLA